MNWYIKRNDNQYGPYTMTDLYKLYQKGEFKKNTPVWVYQEDGWAWIKAASIVELSEIFSSNKKKSSQDGLIQNADPVEIRPTALLADKIWAVAGGKGGVGKSLISSSLSIGLTTLGKKVILVDLDLGGENLHTLFGIPTPKHTILDFLSGGVSSLEDLTMPTNVDRLFLISGQSGALGAANILHGSKLRLMSHLKKLDCDYLILDVGAGTAYNELDFFLGADQGVLVTVPEPHAIQDAFFFVKTAIFRKIARKFKDDGIIRDYFKSNKHLGVDKMKTFLKDMEKLGFLQMQRLRNIIATFNPRVILNQVMEKSELKDGMFFVKSLKDMLHVNADYMGYVTFDSAVRKATHHLRPLLIDHPKSKAATCIFSMIVHKLLNKQHLMAKIEEHGLKKKVRGLNYETTYKGYRSGIGIYK